MSSSPCVQCGDQHHRALYIHIVAGDGDIEGWLCEPCSNEIYRVVADA